MITGYAHDGLWFDVTDAGPGDGEVVVLLHGFPQRASSWRAVTDRLNAKGLRTLAPDQRGYSPGARPKGRANYTISKLVGDVVALIGRAGAPVHLVGHDWGANVAWALASAHPELLRSLTALSVGHPRALVTAMRTLDQARRSWYIAGFQVPWLPERILSGRRGAAALRSSGMDQRMLADYHRDIVADGALPGALNWYRGLCVPGRPGGFGGPVSVPTSYLWGSADTALGRRAADLTARYVTGEYRFVEADGASHWLPEQHPDLVADVVWRQVNQTATGGSSA